MLMVAGCSTQPAILLTVTGDQPAQQYQLFLHDDDNQTLVYSSGWTAVSTEGQPPLDLTKQSLKLALKLSRAGHFTLLLVGVVGQIVENKPGPTSTTMFFAQKLSINGTTNVNAQLLTVPPGDDTDGDFWPDVSSFRSHVPAAATLYAGKDTVLDCDDKENNPTTPTGVVVPLKAGQINPFATPICGIGYSVSCDGTADPCIDKDGDHDVRGHDCDDTDPKRHHATDIDPFPDPPNCCGYSLGKKTDDPDYFTDFLATRTPCYAQSCKPDKMLCPAKRCGDGIDESCRGVSNDPKNDTTCIVDDDCDGYPAPPQGNDCDDHNPNIHPGAPEPCGSTKDLNCNGTIGEGCVPCDLDGDGYERKDALNNCPDKNDKHPGMTDCNDDDAGVFPGSTAITGGTEAGTTIGVVAAGLRGYCRTIYEPINGGTVTAKINAFGGLVGDADCNGVAYQGCPALINPNCDKDGDGFPVQMIVNGVDICNPDPKNQRPIDCDDTDPTTFPGAPDNCKTTKNENCLTPVADCSQDADGDGYSKGSDCDDNNPNIHPWATELCNGVDDDCDQLVDEGNPDPSGKPLVAGGAITSCTDSNTGECGKQLGSCVCSMSTPVVDPLLAMLKQPRTMCPGEGAMGRAPGCFGAGQPAPQSCDATNPKDDDCDGRVDAPDGVRLAAKGMTCGINVGQCKAGIVTACDMTKTNCFSAFNRLPASSAWLVCSATAPNPIAVCPTMEVCNGFDDDCDGHVPGDTGPPPGLNMPGVPPDEFDHDRDHYMACLGCSGQTLAAGLSGCGDCSDGDNTVHPGATEICDGSDNDCAAYNGLTWSDGKDQCGVVDPYKTKPTCCGMSGCQNTQNGETGFCGSCTMSCTATSDSCINGNCACGTGLPCTKAGQTCQNGHCAMGAGAPCQTQQDCLNGTFCVDGICCKSQSCGTCQQCGYNQLNGSNQPVGNDCGNVLQGQHPLNGSCAMPKACDGAGHCKNGLGQSCPGGNGDCFNNICADGVCCNSGCGGQCQHCNSSGSCVQTTGAPVMSPSGPPRNDCNGATTNCYGSCDATRGTMTCDYPGASTTCTSTCVPGGGSTPAALQNNVCDGNGGCVAGTGTTPCDDAGTIKCATSTTCQANCGGDGDCISGDYCSSANGSNGMPGVCSQRHANGLSCVTQDCEQNGCRYCASGNCQPSGQCCKGGQTCKTAGCVSTTQYAAPSCDTSGTCNQNAVDCTPYNCDQAGTNMCFKKCTADNDCQMNNYCNASGACVTQINGNCGFTGDCYGMPTMSQNACLECQNGNHKCSAASNGTCP
jgi:hypothetical protein